MTTRDRWTVYPLLFLALGAALRNKITSTIDVESVASRRMEATQLQAAQVTAKSVLCEDLQINDKEGKPRVRLGTTRASAAGIEIYGRDGKMVAVLTVDPETDLAKLRFQTPDGARQLVIGSGSEGGTMTPIDAVPLPEDADSPVGSAVPSDDVATPQAK